MVLWVLHECYEVELSNFRPSSKSDPDFVDYGTIRIKKIKKNEYVLDGSFIIKRNIGNDAMASVQFV